MSSPMIVTSPRPFQEIGPRFNLIGSVAKSFLYSPLHKATDMRLFTEYIDIDGQTFIGGTIDIKKTNKLLEFFSSRYFFGQVEQFHRFNIGYLEKSQGRITLKINGHDEDGSIFIPLIVKKFEPEGGVDPEIAKRHANIGITVKRYEEDLKDYYRQFSEIVASRKVKDDDKDPQYLHGPNGIGIASGILKIIEESEDRFDEYLYSEEDRCEQELKEKYKDALAWRGPLVRGLISQLGGFELRVYSDDHGKHFHVIHKGKGINARFSFPDMQLIDYKTLNNTISSKQEKQIREFCLQSEIFAKFQEEFDKRPSKVS